MDLIEVGKIVNTRGLKGEVKVVPYLDDLDAFEDFEFVLIDQEKFFIKGVKYFKNNVLITFETIDTIEKAQVLKNKIIWIDEKDLPELNEGEHYVKDLLGLQVITVDGDNLGVIADVFKTGSNDVYTVKSEDKKEIYIPAIKDVVLNIDLDNKVVTVKLLEGLL